MKRLIILCAIFAGTMAAQCAPVFDPLLRRLSCPPSGSSGGANANGYYFVSRSTSAPTNAVNLGSLTTGLLKISVSGSVATPSTAVAGTDYVSTIYSGTKALDTDAIASTACDTMTQSATGVASTDVVTWSFNADVTAVTGYAPITSGGLSIYIWPSTDTINIKVCNPTVSSITPGAVSLNLAVRR